MVLTDIELVVIITLSFAFGLFTAPIIKVITKFIMSLIEKL